MDDDGADGADVVDCGICKFCVVVVLAGAANGFGSSGAAACEVKELDDSGVAIDGLGRGGVAMLICVLDAFGKPRGSNFGRFIWKVLL